jgi:outer membrane beta-barrel protein
MKHLHHLAGLWLLALVMAAPVAAAQETGKKADEPTASAKKAEDKKSVEVREDRIKSVQRKDFLKRNRWELTPLVCLSLNDAFYQKIGGGASFAYHVADSLGIEFQAIYVGTIQTDMVGYFQQANEALPRVSELRYYLMGNILWSPIYGKLSLFTDEIVHFDAYLIGGFGMAYTETGAKLASNIGLGLRYFVTSWLVIKLEVRDLLYTETLKLDVQRTEFSDIQNHVMIGAGVSFFLPVDFDYEYQ